MGDFDGNGTKEIALLKAAHTNFVLVRLTGSTLTITWSGDLDSVASRPWKFLAAADLDGDGDDELVAARHASDGGSVETVIAYRWNGTTFVKLAGSTFGNNGNSVWSGAAGEDFDADGKEAVVLVKNSHSNFAVFDYPGSGTSLTVLEATDLDSVAGQNWRGLAAIDWVGADNGAAELIAARAASGSYRADLFVYGNSFLRIPRDTGLAETEAQFSQNNYLPPDLLPVLTDTHTGTFGWLLSEADDYDDLVEFLDLTKTSCVDDKQLRVWITLIPPTGIAAGRCSSPTNSPITPWDELAYFTVNEGAAGPCDDYYNWASLIGRLAQDYRHIVAVGIDDFSTNISPTFTEDYVAKIISALRWQSTWVNFVPTVYYRDAGTFLGTAWPDLLKTYDSVLFYFRNDKAGDALCEGGGTSCSVPNPPVCNSCLASGPPGTCVEATVGNLTGEVADMGALLPLDGRRLQLGIYFSGHTACGEPTNAYDNDVLNLGLLMSAPGGIAGTTVYTTRVQDITCTDSNYLMSKYCIVRRLYGIF